MEARVADAFLHFWAPTCMLSLCLVTKTSASEPSRKFIKGALLVGVQVSGLVRNIPSQPHNAPSTSLRLGCDAEIAVNNRRPSVQVGAPNAQRRVRNVHVSRLKLPLLRAAVGGWVEAASLSLDLSHLYGLRLESTASASAQTAGQGTQRTQTWPDRPG